MTAITHDPAFPQPAVSIIVPVYRTPVPFLRRCLDHLLGQTLKSIEIIAVNDASPDQCPAVLEAYAARDDRVTVLHRAVNGRAGVARTDGLRRSRGEYVLFADADDVVEMDMCEQLVRRAHACSADIVACSHRLFEAPDKFLFLTSLPERVYDLTDVRQQVQAAQHMRYVMWNKLFRRATIQHLRFEQFPVNMGEDAVFNFSSFGLSRVMATTSYCGYRYMVHPSSASHRRSKGLPYLETSIAAHRNIVDALTRAGACEVVRHYADLWALGRFATGWQWICEEPDEQTRTAMGQFWGGFAKHVPARKGSALLLQLLCRGFQVIRSPEVMRQVTSILYRVASRARWCVVRDKLESRFSPQAGGPEQVKTFTLVKP